MKWTSFFSETLLLEAALEGEDLVYGEPLLTAEARVPEVDDENHALVAAVVADIDAVREAVVEELALALLPDQAGIPYTHEERPAGWNNEREVAANANIRRAAVCWDVGARIRHREEGVSKHTVRRKGRKRLQGLERLRAFLRDARL